MIWHATIMCGSQDAMNISSGILFSMIRLPKKVPLESSACFDVPCSPGVFPKVFVLTTSASEKHRADVGEAQIKTSRLRKLGIFAVM